MLPPPTTIVVAEALLFESLESDVEAVRTPLLVRAPDLAGAVTVHESVAVAPGARLPKLQRPDATSKTPWLAA